MTARTGDGYESVYDDAVADWADPDENGVIRLTDVPPGPFKGVDYTLKKQSGSDGS